MMRLVDAGAAAGASVHLSLHEGRARLGREGGRYRARCSVTQIL